MFDLNMLNVWHGGQLMAFSGLDGQTDYDNGLVARTIFAGTGIEIKLPAACSIRFSDKSPLKAVIAGDCFIIELPQGQVKGAFINAYNLLITGPCVITNNSDLLEYKNENERLLVGSKVGFKSEYLNLNIDDLINERIKWLLSVKLPDDLPQSVRRALLKALSQLKTQVCSPEGQIKHRWTTPDRWPHKQLWLWDSVFHAIGLRHIDVKLAQEIIDAVFDVQQADGFIPLCANPQDSSDITQPPVLALAAKLIFEKSADVDWIKSIYPKLKAYLLWDVNNRDEDDDGLLEWKIIAHPDCRCGESGMDNSPRFDASISLAATDFNSYLGLEFEIMAEFAIMLKLKAESQQWRTKHQDICRLINDRLWSDDHQFYLDYDIEIDKPSEILASSGFLPLICGAASPSQAAQLVKHLNNPQTFKSTLPVASIAKSCEEYYAKDMWRGPVWICVNWLIAFGLRRYGHTKAADSIIHKTMAEQEKMYHKYGTFFEFYDDRGEVEPPQLLRKCLNPHEPQLPNQVFFEFGWSATLYIDMAFERYS
jgi:glycogen debranching enzyme